MIFAVTMGHGEILSQTAARFCGALAEIGRQYFGHPPARTLAKPLAV